MNKFTYILLLCGSLITSVVYAKKSSIENVVFSPKEIIFDNFSDSISLSPYKNHYMTSKGDYVALSNRLILKTSHIIKKENLYSYHTKITQVIPLYLGQSFNYFSIELASQQDLSLVLQQLRKKKNVLLVQPDLLQLKTPPLKNVKSTLINTNTHAKRTKFKKPSKKLNQVHFFEQYKHYLALIGVPLLWQKSKGQGVKIAIIDDGFSLGHKDLKQIKTSFSYDLEQHKLTSFPVHQNETHGTKITGIIFSQHNTQNLDGIAPEAELITLRHTNTWTSHTLLSFYLAHLAKADIINCSWTLPIMLEPFSDIINELATTGRNNKGTIIVFSADPPIHNKQTNYHNMLQRRLSPSVFIVGSHDVHFKPLYQHGWGKWVNLYAYGGKVPSTTHLNQYAYFSGSSLSATIVSGLSALLLSQSPNLSVHQLKTKLSHLLRNKDIHV